MMSAAILNNQGNVQEKTRNRNEFRNILGEKSRGSYKSLPLQPMPADAHKARELRAEHSIR